jgi:hypothetical protein
MLATFVYIYRGIQYIEEFNNTENEENESLETEK